METQQMQLVDQHQNFSPQLQHFISHVWHLSDVGLGYKTVAVFGSQSSGKSTLLNGLFSTQFPVMSNEKRSQTTRGIWLSKAKNAPLLVMDVEGTDGRERGEDQDFERKSALFSLAIAQVFIINMWEHSIGLYNGANIGLLKTVFEPNGTSFCSSPKTLLYFIIRDFLGNTPSTNLENIIKTDVKNIWDSISENAEFSDYFTMEFSFLPHKILQPENFQNALASLSERFYNRESSDYIFQSEMFKIVPIDGFYAYCSGIWEKVKTNKELDLPTQQELLAQFRCDEISSEIYSAFVAQSKPWVAVVESGQVLQDFAKSFESLRQASLESFSHETSRYNPNVVKKKAEELSDKINSTVKVYFVAQLRVVSKKALSLFTISLNELLKTHPQHFSQNVQNSKEKSLEYFSKEAQVLLLKDCQWDCSESSQELLDSILERTASVKKKELSAYLERTLEGFSSASQALICETFENNLSEQLWSNLKDSCLSALQSIKEDLDVQCSGQNYSLSFEEKETLTRELFKKTWEIYLKRLREELSDGLVSSRLRRYFEKLFKYDYQGIPRLWKPGDDIEKPYKKALEETHRLLDVLCGYTHDDLMDNQTNDDVLHNDESSGSDQEESAWWKGYGIGFDQSLSFITDKKKAYLGDVLRREAETSYIESKRSTIQTSSKIPLWMYILLIGLGWNEFKALVSSPLYLFLFVLIGLFGGLLYSLSLLPFSREIVSRNVLYYKEELASIFLKVKHTSEGLWKDLTTSNDEQGHQ